MNFNNIIITYPSEGVVDVKIQRPSKKNALNFQMLRDLYKVGQHLSRQKTVRVVLLTGSEDVFCSGIDLNDLSDPKNRWTAVRALFSPVANMFQNVFLIWRDMPVPVIAVIQGPCFGAGMQWALGADIRIAHPDSQLSIMEAKWGLIPDMGMSVTSRGLIRLDVLKEICMTARVLDAQQAQSIGLITYVSESPMEKAMELAKEIMERSPDVVLGAKRLINSMTHQSNFMTLFKERMWQLRLLIGKNRSKAIEKSKDPTVVFHPRQWK